jgi:hypothetical protein
MYFETSYDRPDPNDYVNPFTTQDDLIHDVKKLDKGYNVVYRMVERPQDGLIKKKKIEIYTSGDMGSRIRDAETGNYYSSLVGSLDEHLFFKVGLSTGECKKGSNTLFYLSPSHYASHLHCSVPKKIVENWEMKRLGRLTELKKSNVKTHEIK